MMSCRSRYSQEKLFLIKNLFLFSSKKKKREDFTYRMVALQFRLHDLKWHFLGSK